MIGKLCVLCGLLLGLAVACSDDEDGATPAADAGPDASSSGGSGGSGGTGGGAGVTTSGGTGGIAPIPPTPPIMCGDTTCPRPPGQDFIDLLGSFGFPVSGGGFFQACCTEGDECGLIVNSGGEDGGLTSRDCVPRPDSDPRCPDRVLLGLNQPSCCIEATGMCGVNTAQVGGGCEDYSADPFGVLLGFSAVPCEGFFDAGSPDEDGGAGP